MLIYQHNTLFVRKVTVTTDTLKFFVGASYLIVKSPILVP